MERGDSRRDGTEFNNQGANMNQRMIFTERRASSSAKLYMGGAVMGCLIALMLALAI